MRWPDIFFKPKASKPPEPAPLSLAPPPPEIAPVALPPKSSAAALARPSGFSPPAIQPPPESASPAETQPPIPAPRIPGRLPVFQVTLPPAPVHSPTPDPNVVRAMEEADTLRSLTRTEGVRLVRRQFPDLPPIARKTPPAPEITVLPDPIPPTEPARPVERAAPEPPAPASAETLPPKASGPSGKGAPSINLSGLKEPAANPTLPPGVTLVRRRTKIADVARVVLPPRREEPTAAPLPPPPAQPEPPPSSVLPPLKPEPSEKAEDKSPDTIAEPAVENQPDASHRGETAPDPGAGSPSDSTGPAIIPPPPVTEPAAEESAPPASLQASAPPDGREKREFILSNGERILGSVLSETPEAIYLDHNTLGVLTIPRSQIAQRPIEIILINGDRIVGDVVAETSESLFVRHASLGILTVPHNQRSSRVVEAILKDGDRILGEVLGETENFTVIRSATLGTVAVPHNRVAMLNRKVEQVQIKALPAPELENKSSG
jgi:RNase P/RNase MRP subunit p29